MKITAVRHGETNENAAGIVQGQKLGTLSAIGLQQIEEVGTSLQDEQFAICISSDLDRCVRTAAAITQYHEGLETIYDKRLRERSMKPLEGKYFTEIEGWNWENDKLLDHKTAEGETWGDVIERVGQLLTELETTYADKHVLVVTHGGPIRALIYLIEQRPWEEVGREMIGNCEVRSWDV